MVRRITVFLLTFLLLFSSGTPKRVYAQEVNAKEPTLEELEEAAKIITESIDTLKELTKDPSVDPTVFEDFKNAFNALSNLASGISSVKGAINSGIAFLQMIGLIEDKSSAKMDHLLNQITEMEGKLDAIDAKLVDIMKAMTTFQASSEFNSRTSKAMKLNDRWADLETNYMNKGMDPLIIQYESEVHQSLIDWCDDPDSRKGEVDNSALYLRYAVIGGKYQLVHSAENTVGEDFKGRYLYLSKDFLPGKIAYSADTYRDDIINDIVGKIKEYVNSDDYAGFECMNFPEFTVSGKDSLTDELIRQMAVDAVDTLTFRTAYRRLNATGADRESFVRNVKKNYEDYCKNLLAPGYGIDALLNNIYLTNAFEGDVKDDIMEYCTQIILKTAMYGNFAIQVTGTSRFLTDDEKNSVVNTYTDAMSKLDKIKDNALTGNDRYCYVTDTLLVLADITFKITSTMKQKKDGSNRAFQGATSSDFSVSVNYGNKKDLIGDVNMLVFLYTVNSSRHPKHDDEALLRTAASNSADIDDKFIDTYFIDHTNPNSYRMNKIVSSYSEQEALPLSAKVLLSSDQQMGNKKDEYFYGDPDVYLSKLPPKATSDYLKNLKTINGTTFSISSQSMNYNDYLSSFATYGESHGGWYVDEAAFLYGPTDPSYEDNAYIRTVEEVKTGDIYYNENFTGKNTYHCLLTEELKDSAEDELETTYSPLNNFRKMSDGMLDEYFAEHSFDNGTVTIAPSCNEEGIMTYSCSHCDEVYTERIAKIDHQWDDGVVTSNATCTEKGIITFTCRKDPEGDHIMTKSIEPLGHDWGAWQVKKEASCHLEGTEVRYCDRCGQMEVRSIQKSCPIDKPVYIIPLTGIGE